MDGVLLLLYMAVMVQPSTGGISTRQGFVVLIEQNAGLTEIPDPIPANVEKIWLNNNEITEIEQFPSHPLIIEFRAQVNKLRKFPNFDGIGSTLKTLHLARNYIRTIDSERLDILTSLTSLDLSNNYISSIPNVGGPANSMTTLYLNNNLFESVPRLDVIGFSVFYLSLLGNMIKHIDREDFRGLPNITALDVSGNLLTEFPDFSLIGETLYAVQFNGNEIKRIPPERLNVFQRLQTILGSSNGLDHFPDFTGSPSKDTIIYMLLDHNQIELIPVSLLYPLVSLHIITLNFNPLKSFPNFCHLQKLFFMYSLGMTMKCDCHLRWLKEAESIGFSIVHGGAFTPCSEPAELVGVRWSDIPMENLTCTETIHKQAHIQPITPAYKCGVRDVVTWVQASSVFECAGHCLDAPGCRFFRYGDPDSSPHDNTCGITDAAAPAADILDVSRPEAWYTLD